MGKAEQLMDGAAAAVPTFTKEIGGVEFVLRRFTAVVSLQVLGSKTFGLIAAESSAEIRSDLMQEKADKDWAGFRESICKVCMVSPAIGDKTEDDSIVYTDLLACGYADAVATAVIGGGDTDFTEPSEDQTGGESPSS